MTPMTTTAPYWISLPNTGNAKIGGASYETLEDARGAAEVRPEVKVAVIGTRRFLGATFPHVVEVITR